MTQPVRLLILGTGTVGASIGLALRRASPDIERVGYDPRGEAAQSAHKAAAVDRVVSRPSKGAGDADLVILTLPAAAAITAAENLDGALRPDTVVLCTARLHGRLMEDVRSRLGPANPCLGAVPFLGPQHALRPEADSQVPAADLFDGGLLGIVAPPGTSQAALDLTLELAAVLHATPFFLDPAELDSAAATSDEFPVMLAAALFESLMTNPGWRDQRRLVGRAFSRLAGLLEGNPAEGAAEWIANRESLLARLDALANELADLRDLLSGEDERGLAERLDAAASHYREWRAFRASPPPDDGVAPRALAGTGLIDRLLGGRRSRA